ncbi:hypothetical protein Tco_1234415 [Tanacetum coccineum]
MTKEPWDKTTDNQSLANILHKSLFIHSNTIIQRNGKVQSFCGLKIANMGATCADFRSLPTLAIETNTGTSIKQNIAASTSRQPTRRTEFRMQGQPRVTLSQKPQGEQPTLLQVFQFHIKPWAQQPTNALTAVQTCGKKKEVTKRKGLQIQYSPFTVRKLKLLGERMKARQYNKPAVAEVAALITNDFGDGVPRRNIIVDKKDSCPN